jgi:hypothetical protein
LDALIAREVNEGRKRVLPVWHNVDYKAVAQISPTLAGRLAVSTSEGLPAVVDAIQRAIHNDSTAFNQHQRESVEDSTTAVSLALADAAELMGRYLQPQPLAVSEAVAELARRSIRSASTVPSLANVRSYLRRSVAAPRVVGYLACQVAAQSGHDVSSWILDLNVCLGDEIREARASRETRPLWQLLVALAMSVEHAAEPDRGYLKDTLHQTMQALLERKDIDPGGECKRMIENVLQSLG